MDTAEMSAAELINILDLAPHPEGGYFRETFCDCVEVIAGAGAKRAAATAIYFLLEGFELAPEGFRPGQ